MDIWGYTEYSIESHLVSLLRFFIFLRLETLYKSRLYPTFYQPPGARRVLRLNWRGCSLGMVRAVCHAGLPSSQLVNYVYSQARCLLFCFCLIFLSGLLHVNIFPTPDNCSKLNHFFSPTVLDSVYTIWLKEI